MHHEDLRSLLAQRDRELSDMSPEDPDYARIKAHRDALEAFMPIAEHDPNGTRYGGLILISMLIVGLAAALVIVGMLWIAGL